jgi:hypothetical protein
MYQKLIAAVVIAATTSVPLAGAALADPMSVGAGGQGGESSSQHANGPKSNPSGTDDPVSAGAQGGLTKDTEAFPGFTVNKDAGTTFAGRTDIATSTFSGTASGTIRNGIQRGHFTGNLPGVGECSGICP